MATSLWRNRDFVVLVTGQTVSEFGSAVGQFALPWLLLQLTGSALQMGLAFAVGFVPYLVLSLPAGVWADRFDRKSLMKIADAGRFLLILSIPIMASFHMLHVWQVYVVQAGMSAFNALFDASYVSSLPNVVGRQHLQQANAALQTGASASQILGPPLAGALIATLGTPGTITANAVSFSLSFVSLLLIRTSFSASQNQTRANGNMLAQIGEGLRFVWNHRLIRTISLLTMVSNLASSSTGGVLLYRIHHDLHVNALWTGVVMTGGSMGTIVGSLVAVVLGKRWPMGRIMVVSITFMTLPSLLIGLTASPAIITLANAVAGFAGVTWNVQSVSLRQSVIPDYLLGRASSAIRMIVWGSIPVGAAAGGAVGQWFGATTVFLAASAVLGCMCLWGFRTPVFRVREAPTQQAGQGEAHGI